MPLTKLTSLGITDGTIVNADINASAAIAGTKLSGAGTVLQVVSTSTTDETATTSTSWVDTTLTANITPSSTSNKIFIIASTNSQSASSNERNNLSIFRGSTNLGDTNQGFGRSLNADELFEKATISYLDSPSTSSQITYTIKLRSTNGGSVSVNNNGSRGAVTLMEIKG